MGALLTAGGVGALQGYTTPATGAQTTGERGLNAGLSGAFGAGGQLAGGLLGRLLERAGGAAKNALIGAPDVPSPMQAAGRVGEAIRGQAEAANQTTTQAYKAVEKAGETVSAQDIQNVFLPQLRQAYQEVAPIIPKSGPLGILRGAEKVAEQGQSIPVSVLESLRKEAVLGAKDINPASAQPFQVMKRAYDTAEQMLPNPSVLQQTARAARASQGRLFEDPIEIARIVTRPDLSGEELLNTMIGAGTKGKAGSSRVIDDVFNAVGDLAPTVKSDLRQAVVARAYTLAGEDAAKLAKEMNKLVGQNESLAARLFTKDELATIGKASKGSAIDKFAQTFARPATYTGGGLAGVGLLGASLSPVAGATAATVGGLGALGALGARQSAADSAALAMSPLLRSIGVQTNTPGLLSRFMAPTAGGLLSIPAQGAFTQPRNR